MLAAAFAAITFRFPFFSGERTDGVPVEGTTTATAVFSNLDASTTIWLTILTILTGAIAFVTIFLFDNRKLQLKLCYLGIFLTVVLLVMYFLEMAKYTEGNVTLWAVFYFAILGCYILAARGVWKDEVLIKSMDRLR